MWKPNGNITAAMQNNTIAVNPTHLAYGMTLRSQLLEASRITVVVTQMQPMKMQIKAKSHSGWS